MLHVDRAVVPRQWRDPGPGQFVDPQLDGHPMRHGLRPSLILAAMIALTSPVRAQELDLSKLPIPPGFLDLKDIALTFRSGKTITATAYTTLANASTFVLVSSTPATAKRRGLILGLKPNDWSLAKTIPKLAVPPF